MGRDGEQCNRPILPDWERWGSIDWEWEGGHMEVWTGGGIGTLFGASGLMYLRIQKSDSPHAFSSRLRCCEQLGCRFRPAVGPRATRAVRSRATVRPRSGAERIVHAGGYDDHRYGGNTVDVFACLGGGDSGGVVGAARADDGRGPWSPILDTAGAHSLVRGGEGSRGVSP